MTKKELNKIKSVAFEEFKSNFTPEEFKNLFSYGNDSISVWRVSENRNVKLLITSRRSQMNDNLLLENGFSDLASVEELFSVNRCTKSIEFVGRF